MRLKIKKLKDVCLAPVSLCSSMDNCEECYWEWKEIAFERLERIKGEDEEEAL